MLPIVVLPATKFNLVKVRCERKVEDTAHRQGNRREEGLILMIVDALGGVDNLIYVDYVATKNCSSVS